MRLLVLAEAAQWICPLAILVDYKKAFDMVNHVTLLRKLEAYNLEKKNPLIWFKSYSIGFIHGSVRTVIVGVPQGSLLGPLLFVMFINDLPLHVHTQVNIFADDTTLSRELSNVDEWTTNKKTAT